MKTKFESRKIRRPEAGGLMSASLIEARQRDQSRVSPRTANTVLEPGQLFPSWTVSWPKILVCGRCFRKAGGRCFRKKGYEKRWHGGGR